MRLLMRVGLLLISLLVLNGCSICRTGCCTFRLQNNTCLGNGCRPEVMVKYPPCIIDYAPDCELPDHGQHLSRIPPNISSHAEKEKQVIELV